MSDCTLYPIGQCTWYCCSNWSAPVGPVWGNGYAWLGSGQRAGYLTASQPSAGDIAVWGQYVGGAGAAGHVALVTSTAPLTVAESNWLGTLQAGVRVVSADSATGITGYVRPIKEDGMATMGQKRATIFNFRVAAFGEWPPNQESIDYAAAQIADDYSNVEQVLTDMLNTYKANGGKPLWRDQIAD